jgi:hypothetical protein
MESEGESWKSCPPNSNKSEVGTAKFASRGSIGLPKVTAEESKHSEPKTAHFEEVSVVGVWEILSL